MFVDVKRTYSARMMLIYAEKSKRTFKVLEDISLRYLACDDANEILIMMTLAKR